MKRFIKISLICIAVLAAISVAAGWFMCSYALLPEEHGNQIEEDRAKAEERYPGIIAWYDNLHDSKVFVDTTITGERGYRLHAVYAPAAKPDSAQGTAIVIHGYTDNHICFMNLVRMYRDDLNYNVVVPDLHYHGLSEGRAVQMGWFDRLDIIRWIDVANSLWEKDFMVVHGVSMGAATTMMVSGEELPPYVRAFVEDCGYASVWDQFSHNLDEMFHLPPFPVLYMASLICKLRYGWSFKEASCLKQLAKCDRPMLFIHGDKDTFVPFENLDKVYDAKVNGYKEKWVAPGSRHAYAYKDHPVEYTAHVKAFLAKAAEF